MSENENTEVRVLTREDVIFLGRVKNDVLNHGDGAVSFTWHLEMPSWTDPLDDGTPVRFLIRDTSGSPYAYENVVEIYAADEGYALDPVSLVLGELVSVPNDGTSSSVETAVAELITTFNGNRAEGGDDDVDEEFMATLLGALMYNFDSEAE